MLSMTDANTPKVSFATPDDVRAASEKAFNIWLGAFSPLWAPFLAATATGLGFWSMSQAMRRGLDFTSFETLAPDTHLFAKWPGFALPFATPWSKGWGEVAEEADHISEVAYEALSAPMQIAFEAEEKLEAAIDEAIATAQESLGEAPKAEDLFSVAETASRAPAEAVTKKAEAIAETTEKTADAATEIVVKTVKAAEKAVDTGAKASETAVKAVIDPATETPVVPSVAEATAEKLPLPLADISPALAPRRPKKPKA